jgi:hypothetical protein
MDNNASQPSEKPELLTRLKLENHGGYERNVGRYRADRGVSRLRRFRLAHRRARRGLRRLFLTSGRPDVWVTTPHGERFSGV